LLNRQRLKQRLGEHAFALSSAWSSSSLSPSLSLLLVGYLILVNELRHSLPPSKTPKVHQPERTTPAQPDPGFGIDLGPTYLAASVHYRNGSYESFILHDPSDEYKAFFREVSVGRERCHWPWVDSEPPPLKVQARWHPDSSQNVPILSREFQKMRDILEKGTGVRLDKAFVAHPKLPALCDDDIADAMRDAGMQAISNRRLINQPHKLNAAYAAYGYGMCVDFTRRNPCEYEERYQLPVRQVMVVTYTEQALLIEYISLKWVGELTSADHSHIDWEAGANALSRTPDAPSHWNLVRYRILEEPVKWNRPADMVLLSGPYGRNETLVHVVRESFAEFQKNSPEYLMAYEGFTAAGGAADLAYRAQWQLQRHSGGP
jgi:hypothetical protein